MKIKIGKTQYTLQMVHSLEPPIARGRVNYTTRTIQIAERSGRPLRKRSLRSKKHTVWHELVHAMLKDMGSTKERDEVFVDELAKRIVQVNKQVEPYIDRS
jgi:hypothetical protein